MPLWKDYHLPVSVDEAVGLLAHYAGKARVVAGIGTRFQHRMADEQRRQADPKFQEQAAALGRFAERRNEPRDFRAADSQAETRCRREFGRVAGPQIQ